MDSQLSSSEPPKKIRRLHNRNARGGIPQENPFVKMLQETRIIDILPQRKVVTCFDTDTVFDVLGVLSMNQILSVPILDTNNSQFLCFVDVLDIVSYIVSISDVENENFDDQLSMWRYKSAQFQTAYVRDVIDFMTQQICVVETESPLYETVSLFQRGVNRVAISCKGITVNVISQSDIARFLIGRMNSFPEVFMKPVSEMMDFSKKMNVISLPAKEPAIRAFKLIHENKISAIALVNNEGQLVGNLSASDLKGAVTTDSEEGSDPFGSLFLPAITFLKQSGMSHFPVITCKESTIFSVVMLKMMALKLHRIWLVDELDRPIGVITLTDVMQCLISQKQEDRKPTQS